jgi:hypothetical protein
MRSRQVANSITDLVTGDLGSVFILAASETMGSCGPLLVKTISIAMCRYIHRIVSCILVQFQAAIVLVRKDFRGLTSCSSIFARHTGLDSSFVKSPNEHFEHFDQ